MNKKLYISKTHKECGSCGKVIELKYFSKKANGYASKCKQCHNDYCRGYYLRNKDSYIQRSREYKKNNKSKIKALKYGITTEELDILFYKHDGKCWICKERNAEYVDHDHACCNSINSCGECVRGALCPYCNSLLGFSRDSVEVLNNAVIYLQARE